MCVHRIHKHPWKWMLMSAKCTGGDEIMTQTEFNNTKETLRLYGNTVTSHDPSTFMHLFDADWKVTATPSMYGGWVLNVEGKTPKTLFINDGTDKVLYL